PVFRPFNEPHSGSFSTAKFFNHHRLKVGAGGEALARFDNGDAALVAAAADRGRVLVWASSVDDSWNDLPLKAVFAPLWQQMLRYVDNYGEGRRWFEVGETITPQKAPGEALPPDEMERRHGFWRFLLIAVLVFLVSEGVLSNRLVVKPE